LELHIDAHSSELFQTLPQLRSLRSLGVSVDAGLMATHLSPLFPQLHLSILKVDHLNFGQSGSSSFFTSLSSLSDTLLNLDLFDCRNLSIADLSKHLPELKNLTLLGLDYCRFRPVLNVDAIRSFLLVLSQTQIATLSLDRSVCSADILEELVASLPSLTSLQDLSIPNCQLGDDSKRAERIWSDCFRTLSKCPLLNILTASSVPPLLVPDLLSLLTQTGLSFARLPNSGYTREQRNEMYKEVAHLPYEEGWACGVDFD
jgi:hypothetical protein